MVAPTFPLVSVALPLFKSRRFLHVITQNLDRYTYPNLEILISDRHCFDDALETLRQRYGHDPRFRFFKERDEICWVENYNLLLDAATGKYFLWTPHDDSFPPDYIDRLVSALEKYPDAMIAIGGIEALYADGTREIFPKQVPFDNDSPWGLRAAWRLYPENTVWLAFHGVMRRDMLMERGLRVRLTRDTFAADVVWDLAAAVLGRFVYVPGCYYQKRYYPDSTHAQWHGWGLPHIVTELAVLNAYLAAPNPSLVQRLYNGASLCFWAVMRVSKYLLAAFGVHHRLHSPLRDAIVWLLGR